VVVSLQNLPLKCACKYYRDSLTTCDNPVAVELDITNISATVEFKETRVYDLVNEYQNLKDHAWSGIPGVYIFYDINGYPLYVGENTRMWQRIREHVRGSDDVTLQNDLYSRFRFVEIYDLGQYDSGHRKLLEQMMIFLKKPLHNRYKLGGLPEADFKSLLKQSPTRENSFYWTQEEKLKIESNFPLNIAKIVKFKKAQEKKQKLKAKKKK
jgi:hypothetical protein